MTKKKFLVSFLSFITLFIYTFFSNVPILQFAIFFFFFCYLLVNLFVNLCQFLPVFFYLFIFLFFLISLSFLAAFLVYCDLFFGTFVTPLRKLHWFVFLYSCFIWLGLVMFCSGFCLISVNFRDSVKKDFIFGSGGNYEFTNNRQCEKCLAHGHNVRL